MILESRTLYINGTHYVRIPAEMARNLKLEKGKNYSAKFEQDEVYHDEEFVFKIGKKIEGAKKNDRNNKTN